MPSLSEAYEASRRPGPDRDPRRVYLGLAVSLLGGGAVLAAILVVATPLGALAGASGETEIQRLAGTLAGLGGPAFLVGVVAVLPSRRRQQLGVGAGAAAALCGVALFRYAYPERWTLSSDPLVFETAAVYFAGAVVALWFVFVAIANFRRRNAPHGTVRLEIERAGETRTVEVSPSELRRYRTALEGGDAAEVLAELESRRDGE